MCLSNNNIRLLKLIKPIAIYLPQFHPIKENNSAWGEGFTEWTNVRKAKPLFEEHYQPHVPHKDIGYYDLRDTDVLDKQACLAKKYGIYGFAFYHYWFSGKRLLNLPIDNMLKSGKPDFPFMFIWANEPWSKRWDGSDKEIIQNQKYSFDDDIKHLKFLCSEVFSDPRYIKINGNPVFIVYRTELLPDIKKTTSLWRREVRNFGFNDIYLVRVENFVSEINPKDIGFNAAVEFSPDFKSVNNYTEKKEDSNILWRKVDFCEIILQSMIKEYNYDVFPCVCPSWDNSPRRKFDVFITTNTSPGLFSYFLKKSCEKALSSISHNEKFVFVNAWNEWGEGCHVEPDEKNGYSFLEVINKNVKNESIQIPQEYLTYIETQYKNISIENEKLKKQLLKSKESLSSIIHSFALITLKFIRKIFKFLQDKNQS